MGGYIYHYQSHNISGSTPLPAHTDHPVQGHCLLAPGDYSIIFLPYVSKILHKKSQVILSKNEGVTAIFPNFDFILNTLIEISRYIKANFDYGYFIIFYALWFQDSTQKISSHFDQK